LSYNGSGTFNINTAGQPVVTGTVISSTAFNALTADLATGLSTAITKDGQTTTTARIVFAQGISSTLTTDATSSTTGSIITAGGISCQKALWVGTTSRHVGATQFDAAITYGGVTLSNAVTGTGNMVLSASPTLTGTLTAAAATFSGAIENTSGGIKITANNPILRWNQTGTGANVWRWQASVSAPGDIGIYNETTTNIPYRVTSGDINTFSTAISYGGVTLSNSVTGTGSMVLSASPTFTGTVTAPIVTASSQTIGTTAANPLIFNINSAEKARFGSDGSFLVGTTTNGGWLGNAKMEVRNTANALVAYNTGSDAGTVAFMARVDNTNVVLADWRYTTTLVGTITTNGTNTSYNTSSDARLKENIADADDAGAIIDALRVRKWDWKSNGAHQSYGFVAQEEALVYADAVTQGDDGEEITRQWGRDDGKLVPLLVKELQSVRARLAALEA